MKGIGLRMAYIQWSEQYMIGIEEIDVQHEKLFELVNSMHEAVINGDYPSVGEKILEDLMDYILEHFATEEKLFLAENYPHYEKHKQEHDLLARQAFDIQEDFKDQKILLTFELLDFLSDWLKKHTTSSDLKYAQFLQHRKQS